MLVYGGNTYQVALQGAAWKPVRCKHCDFDWAYRVTVVASGAGHSVYFLDDEGAGQRAFEGARDALASGLFNASRFLPCPRCGNYQPDMVVEASRELLKELRYLGLGLLAASAVLLFSGLIYGARFFADDENVSLTSVATINLIAAAAASGGMWALSLRQKKQKQFHPNVDAKGRAGREQTLMRGIISREHHEVMLAVAQQEGTAPPIGPIDWPPRRS